MSIVRLGRLLRTVAQLSLPIDQGRSVCTLARLARLAMCLANEARSLANIANIARPQM